MKNLILTLLAIGCIVSCVKKPSNEQLPTINSENIAAYDYMNTVTTMNVPTQEGKISVVTFDGDILCVTKSATSILVPKVSSTTKSDNRIEIAYFDSADPNLVQTLEQNGNSSSTLWQTVAFEDSRAGDYDYNDLVLHLKYELSTAKKENQKLHIGIHPIAYGATKNIGLGFAVYYRNTLVTEQLLFSNSKEELFNDNNGKYCGISGMINTTKPNYHSNFFTKVISIDAAGVRFSDIKVVWYISVDNNKTLYAVNSKNNFLDGNKRPYGIIITDTGKTWTTDGNKVENSASWFEYPIENNNMSQCYPDTDSFGANSFDSWIAGTSDGSFNMRTPVENLIFDITEKEKGHFVYQIENNNNVKDLNNNSYDKVRVSISLPNYQ